ncbi:cell wall-binding protein [Clostridium diolis]|uniref:transglutaminase domain-containing protein n=1 Tax=Clostridium diolis TaxID=223919 RepID=UPI000B400542|nr:transglutaminase-like domain-containing protein [Clostridium diolis]OVE68582.1 cell wall-binding protein [Clostridium diolis]
MRNVIRNLLLGLIIISAIMGQPVFAADNDLNSYVYNHLENWDTEFQIDYYKSDVLEVVQNIAKDDDYLMRSLEKMVYERVGDKATLKVTYRTTKDQELYINQELTKVVNSITTNGMSDFDKVKAINEYLINRFEYDDSLVSNNAYSALTTGKTTCQGYAMTAYKMLKLAGVENKIIIGNLDGVPHGWNLVKLNNKWYHLDVTNNDALGNNKYFLRQDKVLKNDGFTWKESDYPECSEDYNYENNKASSYAGLLSELKSNRDGKWNLVNSAWYFLENTGRYATGWNIIDNNWYYLGNDGVIKTGWIYSNGKWYYCYPGSGAMALNSVIDGKYRVDSNGAWIS